MKNITDMASFSNKKFKRNLNELDSSDNETEAPFPRFIISVREMWSTKS